MSQAKLRVMLIDDSPSDARLIAFWLRRSSAVEVLDVITDAEEAWSRLQASGAAIPDLILLDVNLPRRSGFEVLDEIRRHPQLSGLPVIILTGSTAEEDRRRAESLGANLCLCKPSDASEFGELVQIVESFSRPSESSEPAGDK